MEETRTVTVPPDTTETVVDGDDDNRLFVYGIFLDEIMRYHYGMTNALYTVVEGFSTRSIGQGIVEAVEDSKYALTGLIVDVKPTIEVDNNIVIDNWDRLDRLEAGYSRIRAITVDGDSCWMYVAK